MAAALLGVASSALAYSNPQDFGKYPSADPFSFGFGAGRYYTGSPADAYACDVCHSDPSNYTFPLVQKGLPIEGYSPRTKYKVELSSPLATDAWIRAKSQGNNPISTLMAEFIAENGESAGTVSFPSASEMNNVAYPKLWCPDAATQTDPNKLLSLYGMNIYAQETGSLATEITLANEKDTGISSCTVGRGKDEDGEEYERRCILSLTQCGAQSIKFVWTSPDKWAGPIWFSAGFVTTYDRSDQPNDNDFVSLMSVPLSPVVSAGKTHETVLESGCHVASADQLGSRSDLSRGVGFAAVWLLSFVFVRSRKRQVRARWASLLILFACIGCNNGERLVTNVAGSVGAFEPAPCTKKCRPPLRCRESAWPDAGTAESAGAALEMQSMAAPASGAAGAVDPAAMKVPSRGTVTVQFTTAQPVGVVSDWVRKCKVAGCTLNYTAVWIETADGKYVRTLHNQLGMYTFASLTNFLGLGDDCQVPVETVDVVASATIEDHAPYMLTWDGLYGSGHRAADPGLYKIMIEVAIDEVNKIDVAEIPFMFGDAAPLMMTYPPAPAHTGVTLTYTPSTP